ncbi:MAG TPA: metallophosphoesterase [Xanthobacteraceae bacterium]|nr:metallophosphoesterase [Xanthobacteraceae bacterium]
MELEIAGWPRWSRPLRVAFLSDFHLGSYTGDVPRLEAIVEEASVLAPDLALYGGDFVNMMLFGGGRVPPNVAARILGRLPAPLGRIAVLGNHDRNYSSGEVADALRRHDIVVLSDEQRRITFEGAEIDIVGIHDARRERPRAHALLSSLQKDQPSIVLAHDPYWFKHLPPGPHLMLAGHTHAGQISLPVIGPLRNASHAPLRWTYGLVKEPGKRLYVTSGLGCSALPLRIGAPPEYVIVEVNGA